MTASPEVIGAARRYAEHGLNIIAVLADKRPLRDGWREHGFALGDVLADLARPGVVAIGFPGGALNNNVVPLDFDTDASEVWWHERCEEAGEDPLDFPTVITPGKLKTDGSRRPGRHRYVVDQRAALGNGVGSLRHLGLDIRGKGHTVLPPSPHPHGELYRWAARLSIFDFDHIPDCPDFIYAAVEAPSSRPAAPPAPVRPPVVGEWGAAPKYSAAALDAACREIIDAPPGQQHRTLFCASLGIGGLIAGGAMPAAFARRALLHAASKMTIGDPGRPWLEAQIATEIDNGLARGRESPRTPPELQASMRQTR